MNAASTSHVIDELDPADIHEGDIDLAEIEPTPQPRTLTLVQPPRDDAESQLESILHRLAAEQSELAICLSLPKAKHLYELTHPEARHGGRREQDAKSATCSFADLVAARTGMARRTVYRRLEAGEALRTLDHEAERNCIGTPLANRMGVMLRIAAIDAPRVQRAIVEAFGRSSREGGAALAAAEREQGVERTPRAKKAAPPAPNDAGAVHERIAESACWQPVLDVLDALDHIEALHRIRQLQADYITAMERLEELDAAKQRRAQRRGHA